ncbi:hypothetical protein [Bacteroides intestinalis]|uniref:hypothetical protein n=1 Tax=Bacteroides intestinalis TaxID=329854 RepID=UPI00189FBB15
MKKIACFKHYLANDKKLSALIGHEGKKGSGMARKHHRICRTIGKKLIENYQTTWKLFAKTKRKKTTINILISAIKKENSPSRA